MPEETIWTGTSSQWKNFGVFVVCLILVGGAVAGSLLFPPAAAFALLPLAWMFWRWLKVRSHRFLLSNERLLIEHGVLNKVTETLELYRVRDIQVTQPLMQRMVGLQNLHLQTSDSSTPEVVVDYIPRRLGLGDKFRHEVEACRERKKVREIDIE